MKRYCFLICLLGSLFLISHRLSAQTETPFLLPQTVFVGDSGRLVVPLSQIFTGVEPFVLESPGELPETPDLVIRRIELERRGGSSRLLIDFIPYAPGRLAFPSLELLSPGGAAVPLTLTGLEAQVASILNPSRMDLSEPAPPLAVPGTSLLVYGSLILVLIFLFLGIGGSFWGQRHLKGLWGRLRRRRLLRVMMRFLRRLGQEGSLEKSGNPGYYLTLLSGEFREFLSVFTGVNCRPLAAGEFMELPLDAAIPEQPDGSPLAPSFLCRLFRTWDTLRFSGRGVDKIDLFHALKETETFIAALDRAEKEQASSK